MDNNFDALRATIPDPEVDFDGFVSALADQILDEYRRLVPEGTPSTEVSRLLVIRAAKRLVYALEAQERDYWPDLLIERNMQQMVDMIGWYQLLREG